MKAVRGRTLGGDSQSTPLVALQSHSPVSGIVYIPRGKAVKYARSSDPSTFEIFLIAFPSSEDC